jgi:hypothetical protein
MTTTPKPTPTVATLIENTANGLIGEFHPVANHSSAQFAIMLKGPDGSLAAVPYVFDWASDAKQYAEETFTSAYTVVKIEITTREVTFS